MLTVRRLKELLHYDSKTGDFIWLVRTSGRNPVGSLAGYTEPPPRPNAGRRQIRIDRKLFYAHRLAWFYTMGAWPPDGVDHINGDPSDNRLANLRLATQSQNSRNRGTPKNNTSGFKGVSWHSQLNKWTVRIKKPEGKYLYLGLFDTKKAAADAYQRAVQELHGEFAHV